MKNLIFIFIGLITFILTGCGPATPISSSGVTKATTKIQTDANGHTTEQNNIIDRYKIDNTPGSIKHLYIISAYSGQVIIYSTVKGKVTSSGKRLTPTTINIAGSNSYNGVTIGDKNFQTEEVIQDDGTYGTSIEYLFWFDTKGIYHQQYITGGMIVHVSDQPIAVKNIVINMELTNENN